MLLEKLKNPKDLVDTGKDKDVELSKEEKKQTKSSRIEILIHWNSIMRRRENIPHVEELGDITKV